MSMSDSDTSSQGSEYRNFRQLTRDRLLYEMLRSTKSGDSKSTWKVLVMDRVTVKIMSYACKMADITEEGVSLVEDIYRRRQPLPTMDAIYFMQPTKENVIVFLSDMTGRAPLYKKAFVFFSSPVPRELVSHIKKDGSVLARIGALREMNLEYFAIDSQGFVTDNERALEELFGDEESTRKGHACLNEMATRISTVFASLREFPFVRYRAAKSLDMNTMTTFRDLIPTKLAAGVWNCLARYKANLPNFPQTETCELLIVDRSIDQIAPVIHEWTYDAMCHDLLNMEGNKYVHEAPGKVAGVPEKKEVLLEDHDPIWLELRHAHIADASERLHEKMTSFVSKNKAAQVHHGSRDGGELSTRDLQKMVQALPQYSEQIDKLSLHVDIAGKINRIIKDMGLKELGQLEQDLVFGDAGTKDVINFLRTKLDVTRENKLRLLMIYAACYPEKFESDKITKLMELARLPPEDMNAVNNMRLLEGSSDTKKNSIGAFSLKFDVHKKHAARKDRTGEEVMWQLSRFYPMIEELVEKLSKGELPKNDYPCMNDPSPTFHGSSGAASNPTNPTSAPHSMRQRRATWARPRASDDGYSSDSILRHASSDFKKLGQRIFVFIVGGATRSELRICHKLTAKLKREIVLGSSSLDDPPQFITKLKLMTADELSLDDLQI
ncbi:SNARE-interacting protein KEULE-like isoform X2 [Rhododendron vialii]|uniref:SNARE-interacting protein KEULE-like isoform X2 n=1 Tax=Rhododendron vialii TaxID=182163 RepID=UPI00265DD2F7|nr:SNARE-interacting protein KEULE-like isoform X2 [Rhododendron vialii]